MNSYTYIFLSVVDCLVKHCFYRENSTFLNLLIKKIGSATYHNLSQVITHMIIARESPKNLPQSCENDFFKWKYNNELGLTGSH